MKGLSYGTQSAAGPVFVQFNGDSEFVKVLEVIGSCLRSGWRFRMCLTSLLKLGLQEMRVVRCYASFLQL